MEKSIQFTAIIQAADRGGAFVAIPFDVEEVFGKKRVKVKTLIDNYSYRGSLVRMKTTYHILIIRKDIRKAIGKEVGDEVTVQVAEDTEERLVSVPNDLFAALHQNPKLKTFFKGLSYTHQKEYVNWIEGAKKTETRARRITKAIQMMMDGKKGV